MEALTPVQRVAVIAIGLALTALLAVLVLPWLSKQISERLPLSTPTTQPDTVTVEPSATETPSPTATRSAALSVGYAVSCRQPWCPVTATVLRDPLL